MDKQIKIALAGNPNCGKTTLFNALTGSNQFVGNWPGVTVEKKEGKLKGHKEVVIQDLPGIYSLSPYTLEEVVLRAIGAGADILLFGHTHQPVVDRSGDFWVMNPGCIGPSVRRTYGVITLEDGKVDCAAFRL